jgi:DNA polymerase III epsilon subunit-like protein
MLAGHVQFVVLDFESTGSVAALANEPWQIGIALLDAGRVAESHSFSSLLRVGRRPFNPYAPGRHALLRDELSTAPLLMDLWPVLSPWLLGRVLVAHHAAIEQKFLGEAFPLHHFGPWVDTLELARIAYPRSPSHRLEDLVDALGLTARVRGLCPHLAPHDALYDALACATLLEHLLALPHWQGLSVDDLVAARSGWARGSRQGAAR